MRFTRHQARLPWTDTPRKRAALRRKQRLEREALPLFSEQVANDQPSENEVMAERERGWNSWEQGWRDTKAALWREARKRLYEYGENVRPRLLAAWNSAPYPGHPAYLTDLLMRFDRGDIDLDRLPWDWKHLNG